MSNPSIAVAHELLKEARSSNRFILKMNNLRSLRTITQRELNRVYSACFLDFATSVERQIERLFVGLVVGTLRSSRADVKCLINCNSASVAHRLIRGTRPYPDWLPFDQTTLPRARAFLSGGRPFTLLTNTDMQTLRRMSVLRNAIAHKSSHSMRKFKKLFIDCHHIPMKERRPATYLQGFHKIDQTRFEFFLAEISLLMLKLAA